MKGNIIRYITNSVNAIQTYAKRNGFRIDFNTDADRFTFKVYKIKFWGLLRILKKEYEGKLENVHNEFDKVWDYIIRYIELNR